jgi:hypothetical protein
MEEKANIVGSDETFFDGDPVNLIWKNATDANPELNKIISDLPNVIYATKHNDEAHEKEGVIVYTRTSEENDVLAWVDHKDNIITQSQHTILKAAQCTSDTEPKYKQDTGDSPVFGIPDSFVFNGLLFF